MFVLGRFKALTFGKQGNKKMVNSLGLKSRSNGTKLQQMYKTASRSRSSQFRDWPWRNVFSPDIFLGVFLITSHYYQVGTWITFVKFQFHKAPKMAEITSAEVQLNDPLWSFLASELWQKKMYQRSGIPKHTSNPTRWSDDLFDSARIVLLCRFHIDMAGGGKATFGVASLWS